MSMTRSIFGMFAPSPIRPLQKHMAKSYACAAHLEDFFKAILMQDLEAAERHQNVIVQLENEADDLKKALRLSLPSNLFLPLPRTDILETLRVQDRVANKAKDIAGLILGRKMQIPEVIADDMLAFVKRSIDAAGQANKAINELDELLETGFRGREVDIVEEMITKLNDIEHDTDEIQIKIRRAIFTIEKDLAPIDTMFLYKAVDWIGELADRAQSVGGRLSMLLAR